ncbi:MAG: DUF3862 domain-containing protein [Lactobacillus delbrueckii]|uniref:DUF3862 domain-containing protein n=1 Tax=Lactobacillus delbrueckii TaxID=1584 RepID=UPI00067FEE55|nr:DUF3862 domain-containing protein [Lactobacillus delbrueckii]MCD5449093.1 DUF3862 domain-containing protein [Lactobacillus delbrueckii subsp. bulgaricus]MCH5408873.1 DUF3862 domain-containing protein [Lactobacillus delbrueckii]MCT3469488.1 DUF3862 domain-containing protein [Lactobacillus delbrueckii subsp. bulgaricus]MEC3724159.1 DUF3862 domain-containing protein [Lactobacillus delbrueckii subsp. bulgaricus]PTE06063.1 DUF3862 domain-containing protein [Lactobacillus delbrueckii]
MVIKKVALVAATSLVALSMTACGASTSSQSSSSSKSTATSSSSKSTNKVNESNFNKIKIGNNGSTIKEVQALFGKKASQTSEVQVSGTTAKNYTWSGLEGGNTVSGISVAFVNGKAVQKTITGKKVTRSKKISQADFEKVQTGMSKSQVKKLIGEPDTFSYAVINGQSIDVFSYTTGVKGDVGANAMFTFNNDAVTTKSQSGLQ